jgi:hypothetical protein
MKKEKNERKKDVQPESMKELMFFFSPGGINHSIATGVDIDVFISLKFFQPKKVNEEQFFKI